MRGNFASSAFNISREETGGLFADPGVISLAIGILTVTIVAVESNHVIERNIEMERDIERVLQSQQEIH